MHTTPTPDRKSPALTVKDYSKAYGYTQEHHTFEYNMRMWRAHNNDVTMLGTPPPCHRFTDLPANFWNKGMGNVDTVQKVVKNRKGVRGPDSGPGSPMWFDM